ncbi:hypothetical protein D3C87_1742700 [compost metagenome]
MQVTTFQIQIRELHLVFVIDLECFVVLRNAILTTVSIAIVYTYQVSPFVFPLTKIEGPIKILFAEEEVLAERPFYLKLF